MKTDKEIMLNLIGEQQVKIRSLEQVMNKLDDFIDNLKVKFYCIGGPLNDNKLGYTKEQTAIFYEIIQEIETLPTKDEK